MCGVLCSWTKQLPVLVALCTGCHLIVKATDNLPSVVCIKLAFPPWEWKYLFQGFSSNANQCQTPSLMSLLVDTLKHKSLKHLKQRTSFWAHCHSISFFQVNLFSKTTTHLRLPGTQQPALVNTDLEEVRVVKKIPTWQMLVRVIINPPFHCCIFSLQVLSVWRHCYGNSWCW